MRGRRRVGMLDRPLNRSRRCTHWRNTRTGAEAARGSGMRLGHAPGLLPVVAKRTRLGKPAPPAISLQVICLLRPARIDRARGATSGYSLASHLARRLQARPQGRGKSVPSQTPVRLPCEGRTIEPTPGANGSGTETSHRLMAGGIGAILSRWSTKLAVRQRAAHQREGRTVPHRSRSRGHGPRGSALERSALGFDVGVQANG
jgi:hypothetical protein